MERTTAAMVAFTVMSGPWQVSATTSSRRLLPQRFKGETTARRGACSQAGWAWLAATHKVTASAACGLGKIT
jgi:hypothetical protein